MTRSGIMPLELDCPLTEATYVVVDLETTGLKPPWARITEIAAIRIRNGECDRELAQLVDPLCAIPPQITQMTGISNAMVAGQPTVDDIWPYFQAFLEDAIIVAHNAPFDLAFLDHDARRLTGETLPNPDLCTVKLSRKAWPELERHNLDTVAQHLGLNFIERHRALGDARVTAQVLLEIFPYLEQGGIRTVREMLRIQKSSRCQGRLEDMGEWDWA